MSKVTNEVFLCNGYIKILVKKSGHQSYTGTILIDTEDLTKVGKVRITGQNYAYSCGVPSANVAHIVMNHVSNMTTTVDHINGNRLDNRKTNLRVISFKENANNRTKARNNTGIVGISLRNNGKYTYYRVTVSDRKTPMKGAKAKTKQVSKQFNINKLGKEKAFMQAQQWLKAKKKEFNYVGY